MKPIMSFGSVLSSLLRLDNHTRSLQTLEYIFMLTLLFSYRDSVRAASFVRMDRQPAGASGGNRTSLKKFLDVVVATIAIALSAPLMLCAARAIKRESLGPIIFGRKRIGLNGSIFEIWKFRSVCAEHPDPDAARQTSEEYPRATRVRRVIQRSSIDDLPQLLNVIQGRMSVAGPRAHALDPMVEARPLEKLLEGYAARHRDKPGIPRGAQINGSRGEHDSVEKLKQRSSTPSSSNVGMPTYRFEPRTRSSQVRANFIFRVVTCGS
jgi:lipopolysaccharide/colanic/teichoic acid biosynthesis glycosyltransferase